MGKEAALVTIWTSSVPGREKQALECFMDYMTLMGKHAADGTTAEPQAYLEYDGSGGMGIVRGRSDALLELWESDEFRTIISRAQLTVQNIHTRLFACGDTVPELMSRYSQTAGSLGYM